MKKRILSVILAAMMALTAFTGCNSGGAQSSSAAGSSEPASAGSSEASSGEDAGSAGENTISMYHSWSTDTERGKALNDLIAKFNEDNAGKIKIDVNINPDFPAYQEKVKAMISANETPDIFHYNFNPNDLSRQKSGKLLDFTPYMDDEWKARFNESDLETLTVDGQLTSIPFEKGGALIYYNKELFDAAGVAEFPATWDDLFTAFDKLKANGTTPISLYTADDAWYTTNLLTYFAVSIGGSEMFNKGGDINTPELVKAAEYLRKAFDYTTGDAIGANYSVSSNAFASGKTAMLIDGPWLIGSLPAEIVDKVAIAPAPTFGDGKVTPGFSVTDAQTPWAAAGQSDKAKEEAIVSFMKFITSEDSTKALTLNGSVFLSAKMTLTDDEMASAGALMANYIEVNSAAQESVVNLQRNLTTAANSKLPSLLESLALDQITAQQFVEQLAAENQ